MWGEPYQEAQDVMNAQTLPQVQIPNREHFILAYPTPRQECGRGWREQDHTEEIARADREQGSLDMYTAGYRILSTQSGLAAQSQRHPSHRGTPLAHGTAATAQRG
jgi:hypothetical protein